LSFRTSPEETGNALFTGWPTQAGFFAIDVSIFSFSTTTIQARISAPLAFIGMAVAQCSFNAQSMAFVSDVGVKNVAFSVPVIVTNQYCATPTSNLFRCHLCTRAKSSWRFSDKVLEAAMKSKQTSLLVRLTLSAAIVLFFGKFATAQTSRFA
jgi:hypothetical protein